MRVLKIVAGIVLLGIAMTIIGRTALTWAGKEFVRSRKDLINEAVAFGRSADQDGCLNQTFVKLESCSGLDCGMAHIMFLDVCLGEAAPSPGFCSDVPALGIGNHAAIAPWRKRKCLEFGSGEFVCGQVLGIVQDNCHPETSSPG